MSENYFGRIPPRLSLSALVQRDRPIASGSRVEVGVVTSHAGVRITPAADFVAAKSVREDIVLLLVINNGWKPTTSALLS